MQLSLDCLTMTDTSPLQLVECAGGAGFDAVTVWTNPLSAFPKQVLTSAMLGDCLRALDDNAVKVHAIEAFELVSAEAIESFRPAFELGARIGARAALFYHLGGPGGGEAAELLALAAQVAGEFGLGVNIEPISMGQTRSLREARDLIRAAGVDAGIVYDTLHLIRSGGSPRDLDEIDPALIRHVQIDDGAAKLSDEEALAEASGERLFPGQGDFPLEDLLRSVPRDIPWGIEVPSIRAAAAGKSPLAHAREAMAAMQGLLGRLGLAR